jgi:hypothetical protein
MATPNRQICAQMMVHLAALPAINNHRSARNRAKNRVTLGNWPRTRHDVGKTTKRELTLKAKRERTG